MAQEIKIVVGRMGDILIHNSSSGTISTPVAFPGQGKESGKERRKHR